MKTAKLPFALRGFAASGAVFAILFLAGTRITGLFRRGGDADMEHRWADFSLLDYLQGLGLFALVGALWLLIIWWVANRTPWPRRMFLVLAPGIPGIATASMTAWFIVQAALEPPLPVIPFESNNVFYLPNWLQLATIVSSFLASALTYRTVARAAAAPIRP